MILVKFTVTKWKIKKNAIDKQRKIREEKEAETLKLFRKSHQKTDENVKKYKEEHHSRWLIEQKIRNAEDEKEKQYRKKEDENIEIIKNEMKEQKIIREKFNMNGNKITLEEKGKKLYLNLKRKINKVSIRIE